MKILKLKSILFSLMAIIITTAFFTSCEDDEIKIPKSEIKEVKKQRSELAKHLSILIADEPEFNMTLKEMCLKEIEKGYYEKEFFFNVEKDKSSKLLAGNSLDNRLSLLRSPDLRKAIDYLMINDPGLAILMIGDENSKEFNTKVYVDNGFDDSNPNAIIEYYENGKLGSHSIAEEPSVLTFIVRESEAYLSPEELLLENPEDVTKIGDVANKEINVFGYNNEMSEISFEEIPKINQSEVEFRGCERDRVNGKERFRRFKTTNDHETFKGKGEFIFDIVFKERGGGISKLRIRKHKVKEGIWYYLNKGIITWETNDKLERMFYKVMEEDGGPRYTVKLGVSGEIEGKGSANAEIEVQYKDDDDEVGEEIVEYKDDIFNFDKEKGGIHYAGSVTFQLGQW